MLTIDLKGKSCLVIGGARGIGASVVRTMAAAGCNVAWTYLDIPADIEASKEQQGVVSGMGVKGMARAVNCTDEKTTMAFVDDLAEQWGGLNYLVFCAGFTSPVPFMDLNADEWRRVVDINLTGAFIATRAVIGRMLKSGAGGSIVLIGSAAIIAGGGGRADYVSAKAGLEGLNRAITKEFAPKGIRCNLVHPSLIETDLLKGRYPDPAKRAEAAGGVPLGRLGQPEDIANAVAFLLSDMASYITGQSLFVDGGRTFCK